MLRPIVASAAFVSFAAAIGMFSSFFVSENNPDLSKNNGLIEFKGKNVSGWIYSFYSPLRLRRVAGYRNGKKHGREVLYFENGQKWSEQWFDSGKPDGLSRGWYKDGKPRFTRNYKNGVSVGEYWAWHDNGQLSYFVKYASGKEVAFKTWSYFGKPFYNYVWQNNYKIGLKGGAFCKRKSI